MRGCKVRLGAAILWLVSGCGDSPVLGGPGTLQGREPPPAAGAGQTPAGASSGAAEPVALGGGPLRVIEVPPGGATIVETPLGYFALGSQTLGHGKVTSGAKTGLYRSRDGVRWERVRLAGDEDSLGLTGLAYGAGRFVMVGRSIGDGGGAEVWTSADGEQWEVSPGSAESTQQWRDVVHLGDRFFGIGGHQTLGVSKDGRSWQVVPIGLVQVMGMAYGAGRYVVVGSGGIESSADGYTWEPIATGCDLPDACVTDPSGGQHVIVFDVVFANGQFRAGPFASSDGISWSPAELENPGEYVGGRYFRADSALEVFTTDPQGTPVPVPVVRWSRAAVTSDGRDEQAIGRLDRDTPWPHQVDVGFEDGLTCEQAACLLIGDWLYLVPPPGTLPLTDRTPRDADGAELLSDACPSSHMVFCEDYERRTGCRCDPTAPRTPEACGDVGAFACEGTFIHQDGEWQVPDVGAGGCHCDHIDPGEPASFGDRCDMDPDACQPPLACHRVNRIGSTCCFPEAAPHICTARCSVDADCPTWEGTGHCAGPVRLRCEEGVCQGRTCDP